MRTQAERDAYTEFHKGTISNARAHSANTEAERQRWQDDAIAHFTEAIKLGPEFAEAYHQRGLTYTKQRDFDRAIADFSEAIELERNNALFYYNRGLAYTKQRDFDRAIVDLNKAIELKHDYAEAYNNLGHTHYTRGVPRYMSGNVYDDEEDLQKAIQNYDRAIELRPDDPKVYFNRALVWLVWQDYERAKSNLIAARDKGVDLVLAFFQSCGSSAANVRTKCDDFPEYIVEMVTEA